MSRGLGACARHEKPFGELSLMIDAAHDAARRRQDDRPAIVVTKKICGICSPCAIWR